MKVAPTFTAQIYVGTYCKDEGRQYDVEDLAYVCQDYCDEVGFCVSFTKTRFIYTNGSENGAIVGIINYPRFPSTPKILRQRTIKLAKLLQKATKQYKVSIVFQDETVMLERKS